MKRSHSVVGWGLVVFSSFCAQVAIATPAPQIPKHVHTMHLDGFRGDLFMRLVDLGQLPNFGKLLTRGKISTTASTVDKSETMKVIEAYLTSRRDTTVVGWWQFNRETFQFRNFWMDPAEVANFALGLDFPVYPTVFDYLSSRGENVTAGFSLHRRSVPFRNYTRNYIEGLKAAFDHTYYDQAHATMNSILKLYDRIARDPKEKIPAFSMSLLAAADEFGHLEGVGMKNMGAPLASDLYTRCIRRKDDKDQRANDLHEQIFKILEADEAGDQRLKSDYHRGLTEAQIEAGLATGYFTRVVKTGRIFKSLSEICFKVPTLRVHMNPSNRKDHSVGDEQWVYAQPNYVLGMMLVDIEVGNLVHKLKSIRFRADGSRFVDPAANATQKASVGSLFDNTLFIFLGDHGMADTKRMMVPEKKDHFDPNRHPESQSETLIQYLNRELALTTTEPKQKGFLYPGVEIGIDDTELPERLVYPHKYKGWQSSRIHLITPHAEDWSKRFFGFIGESITEEKIPGFFKLFYLKFLVHPFVKHGVSEFLAPKKETIIDTLTKLYLKGYPEYVEAERVASLAFFNKHVRLVYGGGARNNAELFLPATGPTWSRRPTYDEILKFYGGDVSTQTLLEVLKKNPAVGLIFIRMDNEKYVPGQALPEVTRIRVMDRFDNRATISVRGNSAARELVYHYQVDSDSAFDPLDYGDLGKAQGTWGTYNEWNDRSVENRHYYHNVVAGIGTYLHSANPSIGDVLLMRSQGWNFGDNAGGHGGVHREEKLTLMMVSGPGIQPGQLLSRAKYATLPSGQLVFWPHDTQPTVLDAIPTALAWLGHGEQVLTRFSRDQSENGFEKRLRRWVAGQKQDLLQNLDYMDGVNEKLDENGLDGITLGKFREWFDPLFRFLPKDPPPLPDFNQTQEDGNLLRLGD